MAFKITDIYSVGLLKKHKVFVVPVNRSKQSHLSLLSWKLTSASKQFNPVRTLLCCWPLRQHVCSKNSMVEGVWLRHISITLLMWHIFPWKLSKSSSDLSWRIRTGKERNMGYYWDKGVQELENTAYGKKIQLENRIFTLVSKKDLGLLTI